MQRKRNKNTRERGQAVMEVTLMAPWIFFLFVGILDTGFYSYAAICTQNAARAAATQTAAHAGSQQDTISCPAAIQELSWLPNVKALGLTGAILSDCAANAASIDATHPVAVQRQTLCGKDVNTNTIKDCIGRAPTNPPCADCAVGLNTTGASSQVAVTYQTPLMVSIPGIITNQLTLTRVVEARIVAE
jgi:Flp pilus assembly protein TadG